MDKNRTKPCVVYRTILFAVILTCAASSLADVAWSDSPRFSADLRSIPTNWVSFGYGDSRIFSVALRSIHTGWASIGYGDSGSLGVNLYPLCRGQAESGSFSFNCLANSGPVSGVRTPPQIIDYDGLLQFDGSSWVTPYSLPNTGDAVVILNHGWNSWPEEFAQLAQALKSRSSSIFIYSWRWGYGPNVVSDANPNGQDTGADFIDIFNCTNIRYALCFSNALQQELQKTMTSAFKQGRSLGNTLFGLDIRPDRQYIHIIGHSFGGIVSSEAATVLKERSGTRIQQFTTLDTPGIIGIADAVKYLKVDAAERSEVIYYDALDTLIRGGTGRAYPYTSSSLLNYQLNPVNMAGGCLHSEAVNWYIESANASVFNCNGEPYGFGWSVALHKDRNWNLGLPFGNKIETAMNRGCMEPLLELASRYIVKQKKELEIDFLDAASWAGQKAELVIDAVGSAVKTAVRLSITTGLSPMEATEGDARAADSTDTNESYIFQTIAIPANAQQIILDLRFAKVGQGDVLTVSLGDENLMVIDAAAFGQTESYTETPPAYIGQYADQTVTLQIALRGSGDNGSEVLIDAIRFVGLTLAADTDDDGLVGLTDVLTLADYWMAVGCAAMNNCDGADIDRDNDVDLQDFTTMAEFWLETL